MSESRWQPLQQGDIVDIVAPGFREERSILKKIDLFLASWGLQARYPKDIFGKDAICSNSREKRFEHLLNAISAKDSKAVWCLRGGYGAIHLLPLLHKKLKGKKLPAKLLIGLSDVSSLHLYMNQFQNWATVHGPMMDRLALDKVKPKLQRELKGLVFGDIAQMEFSKLKPMNEAAKKNKNLLGPVVGGNMVTVASSLGTPFQIDASGKILFFEDIGERGYRIDRLLEQMSQAGIFNKVKAVVFGEFLYGAEANGKKLWKNALQEFANRNKFPILSGVPCGHGLVQRPVPFGVKGRLSLVDKTLIIPTGARF